jgi:uncharacterized membrane-anchored protein
MSLRAKHEPGARRRFRRARGPGITGTARIDVRTKNLLHRLKPGEIAVILHEDIDELAAEGLVERGAAAVVNCHRSITGRYPNGGPLVLAREGIPLVDAAGEAMLERVREGDTIRVDGGDVHLGDELVATGTLLEGETLARAMAEAQAGMGARLEEFVRNTMEFLGTERDLVLQGVGIPDLQTPIAGRDAVVVVRGKEFRRDLKTLRGYISDIRPALIAVDGAADAMLEEGLRPDVIIGDMDSVSTDALTCGAEIVVHAYPDGRAPGLERLQGLGVEATVFPSAGTSEDIALLLAFEKGADLIVAVGAHDNLVDFLDKGRGGMASTFIVRLKIGSRLVDARGVNRLYHSRVRTRDIVLLVTSALAAMLVAGAISPSMRLFVQNIGDWFHDVWRSIF